MAQHDEKVLETIRGKDSADGDLKQSLEMPYNILIPALSRLQQQKLIEPYFIETEGKGYSKLMYRAIYPPP